MSEMTHEETSEEKVDRQPSGVAMVVVTVLLLILIFLPLAIG